MSVDNEQVLFDKFHDKCIKKVNAFVSCQRTVLPDDELMLALGLSIGSINNYLDELKIIKKNGLFTYSEQGIEHIVKSVENLDVAERIFELGKNQLLEGADLIKYSRLDDLELIVFTKVALRYGDSSEQLTATRIINDISLSAREDHERKADSQTVLTLLQKWEKFFTGRVITQSNKPQKKEKQGSQEPVYINTAHLLELLSKKLGFSDIKIHVENNELKGMTVTNGKLLAA